MLGLAYDTEKLAGAGGRPGQAGKETTTLASRIGIGMIEAENENLSPQGELSLKLTALPRDANGFGDVYGGWLVSQMDLAGAARASKAAAGRVATVSIDRMAFLVPVAVGSQLSFYTQLLEVGRSSLKILVETWGEEPLFAEPRKVTEAVFVFVAIDGNRHTRAVPPLAEH